MTTISPSSSDSSLRRNDAFRTFWSGRTVSMFGSQVTTIALPITASVLLAATPGQMAALWGVQFLPNLLIGLFAGAWIDRLPRRPVLITADIARAVLLAMLPLAGVLGMLRIELIYAVSILVSVCNVFADAADNAYLPSIVPPEHVLDANAKLAVSGSIASVAGPGLAGILIDALRATGAIAVDAASFLVSALALSLIRECETPPETSATRRGILREILEGLRVFYGNRILRTFLATTVTFDIFWNALFAVYYLYVTRDLGLPTTAIGLIFGVGSVGALLAARLTKRITARYGVGATIIGAQVVLGLAVPLIALPLLFPAIALPLLVLAEFILSGATTISAINRGSVIQTMVPNRLLGRVWASQSVIGLGIVPVGALLGGVLGETFGVPTTIIVGSCGGILSFWWLVFSPVRTMRHMPTSTEE